MKRTIILTVLTVFSLSSWAQPKHHLRDKKEKVDAMKAAYITRELDLSSDEAQQFWPVYNEMDKKIEELRLATAEKMMKMRDEGKKVEDMSDEELKAMMEERLENDEKIAQIKKQYHEKFLKILGVKKTAKLYMAEMDFTRELMRKTRQGPPEDREPMRNR